MRERGESLSENRFSLSSRLEPISHFTQSNLGFWQFHLICIRAAPPMPPLSQGTRHGSFAFQSFVNRQMKHDVTVTYTAFTWRHKKQWLHSLPHSFPPSANSPIFAFLSSIVCTDFTRASNEYENENAFISRYWHDSLILFYLRVMLNFVSFSFCGASRPERWEPFFTVFIRLIHFNVRRAVRVSFCIFLIYSYRSYDASVFFAGLSLPRS